MYLQTILSPFNIHKCHWSLYPPLWDITDHVISFCLLLLSAVNRQMTFVFVVTYSSTTTSFYSFKRIIIHLLFPAASPDELWWETISQKRFSKYSDDTKFLSSTVPFHEHGKIVVSLWITLCVIKGKWVMTLAILTLLLSSVREFEFMGSYHLTGVV